MAVYVASRPKSFLSKFARSKSSSKPRASRSARAMRHLRSGRVNYQSRAGRATLDSSLKIKKNSLKDTINKFKGVKLNYEFGSTAVIIGLFILAVSSSMFYLAHFSNVATKGYELKRLEADHQQLLNQYEIKNMKLAEVKALKRIASSERVSAMRRPSNIEFIHGTTAIASR